MKCLRIIWIYFLLFLVIFPVVAEKESAEETIVLQVVGEAFMIDGQIAKARELAVANGLQQAVEQAVGVLVYSETQVENYELIRIRSVYARPVTYQVMRSMILGGSKHL